MTISNARASRNRALREKSLQALLPDHGAKGATPVINTVGGILGVYVGLVPVSQIGLLILLNTGGNPVTEAGLLILKSMLDGI